MDLPGPLIDHNWLTANIDEVEIADVRWSIPTGPKLDDFMAGHVPGAVFVDLDTDLSDPPGPRGRHPLPSPADFRRSLARLGLGRRPTVCYDDSSGATAARMWWMLDALGHPAAVLDGGLATWTGPLSTDGSSPGSTADGVGATIGDPLVVDWPAQLLVDVDQVLPRLAAGATLLDARSAERFEGQANPIDPVSGRIPGARSRPWTENLSATGTLLPAAELRRQFGALGVDGTGEWLASCGSGVTACHNLLAARVAGLGDGRLYAGSWSEWIGDDRRPVQTGPGVAVRSADGDDGAA